MGGTLTECPMRRGSLTDLKHGCYQPTTTAWLRKGSKDEPRASLLGFLCPSASITPPQRHVCLHRCSALSPPSLGSKTCLQGTCCHPVIQMGCLQARPTCWVQSQSQGLGEKQPLACLVAPFEGNRAASSREGCRRGRGRGRGCGRGRGYWPWCGPAVRLLGVGAGVGVCLGRCLGVGMGRQGHAQDCIRCPMQPLCNCKCMRPFERISR